MRTISNPQTLVGAHAKSENAVWWLPEKKMQGKLPDDLYEGIHFLKGIILGSFFGAILWAVILAIVFRIVG